VKIALSILCGLFFISAQVAPAAIPVAVCGASHTCGCSDKMDCCKTAPIPSPVPLAVATSGDSYQLLSAVPAKAILTIAITEANPFSSASSTSLTLRDAPIFARHCVRLI
jgi:hypothetical protein